MTPLMTNGCRARVIPWVDGTYPLCNNGVESVSQLLLHCLSVTGIWYHNNIDFHIMTDEDAGSVVKRWLGSSICSSATFVHVSMIMWQVWKNRCKWVFEGISFSTKATKIMTNSTIQWMNSAQQNAHETPPYNTTHQSGAAPPLNMLKINADDSTMQDNACAVAMRRDSQGWVKLAVVAHVTTSDPEHAEANTILLRLKLAANMRDTSCIIVSDAKSLVHWICNIDSVPSWRVAHVVYECRSLLQVNTNARLELDNRSTNEATHHAGRLCLNH